MSFLTHIRSAATHLLFSGKAFSLAELAKNRKMRRMGWNEKKLKELDNTLRSILVRFKKIAKHDLNFKIIYLSQPLLSKKDCLSLDLENEEIRVCISADPKAIMEQASAILATRLIEALFDERNLSINFSGPPRTVLNDKDLVIAAFQQIYSFYQKERSVHLDISEALNHFDHLTKFFGIFIIQQKLIHLLAEPYRPPISQLALEIEELTEGLRKRVLNLEGRSQKFAVWGIIARLAIFSTLAKKAGLMRLALRSHDLLSDEFGEHLIRLELIELRESNLLDGFTNLQHPFVRDLQTKMAIKGYRLMLNNFQLIFDFYFDGTELF